MYKVLYVDDDRDHLDEFREVFADYDVSIAQGMDVTVEFLDDRINRNVDVVIIDGKIVSGEKLAKQRYSSPGETLAEHVRHRIPGVKVFGINRNNIWTISGHNYDGIIIGAHFSYLKKGIERKISRALEETVENA